MRLITYSLDRDGEETYITLIGFSIVEIYSNFQEASNA